MNVVEFGCNVVDVCVFCSFVVGKEVICVVYIFCFVFIGGEVFGVSRNVSFGFFIEFFVVFFGFDYFFFDGFCSDVWSVFDRCFFDYVSVSVLGFGFMCGNIVCDVSGMDFGFIVDFGKKCFVFLG